jgi:hypothetical protein
MTGANKESKLKNFFKFDNVALIVGFTVDIITLTSIVFSLRISNISENLPTFISPALATCLWILAVYLYFAYLHSYWENHQSDNKYSDKFSRFLAGDLLVSFRNPLLLLPGIIALISLFWIASTESSGVYFGLVIMLTIILGIPLLITAFFFVKETSVNPSKEASIPKEFKERVNQEWEFLSSHINEYLTTQMWVNANDLSTIAAIWEVPEYYMNYVLAQFALKNYKKTRYGYLYSRTKNFPVYLGGKVLINLEAIDYDEYRIL